MIRKWLGAVGLVFVAVAVARGEDYALHSFERKQLTDVYYSEGIAAGDLDGDGHVDLVYGPYWFAGPDFASKREIYPAKPQNRDRYADHFFAWVHDFNRDGRNDVLTAGFPGTPAFVYENPGKEGHDKPWPKHQVLDSVANEAPQPELVCTNQGYFGYAPINSAEPLGTWKFIRISEKVAPIPFGHGLGVGDVNGDNRQDILMKDGWFEQPVGPTSDSQLWTFHGYRFAAPGGAEMYS
jgi:hypothetical protein